MIKQQKKKAPSLPTPAFLTPEAQVAHSPEVRQMFSLLAQGKTFQEKTFPVYQNFLIELRNALLKEEEETFLAVLARYLQMAVGRLPSAPMLAKSELLLMELRVLIAKVGLVPVARYLLSLETTN